MRFRTWPVAGLGLGGLLLLVVVSVLAASNRAQEIYTQLDQLNTHHRDVETKLRRLRADVHLSGIFMRDYLLDTERSRAPDYREQLADFRQQQRGHGRRAARADAPAAGLRRTDREPRGQARRLLAGVRSAVRLDAGREDPAERRLPPPRGAAAARGGAGIANGNRGAEQRQPRDAARRGDAAATPRSAAISTSCSGAACCSASSSRLTAVIRLRVARAPHRRASAPSRPRPSGRCASCRSSWSRRRKRSARSCRASCTITSARC